MNSEKMKASQMFIAEMEEKLKLLKDNIGNLPIREALSLAASIRDDTRNNNLLNDMCNGNIALAKKRKDILSKLSALISNLIDSEILDNDDDFIPPGRVVNFDVAKTALVELIEKEQKKKLFCEQEEDKLLDGITECQTHTNSICRIAGNCKNGKFLTLIVGEYQSGKSSMINAFCNGRYVCAIGGGTATSAVLVSISYAEEETLKINWREKEQFKPIFERIKRVVPNYAWNSFDLDKSEERKSLAAAIEVQRCSNAPGTLEVGDIRFLMLCDLILKYYGSEDLQKKKKSLISMSSVSEITKFPTDGETNWYDKGVKGFTIDDAIFVFIDSVTCTIPSETLKQLNCTFIDSPGLFNSEYDTMVTERAMIAAHAIIYVLPYHKGIGKEVCQSLYDIRDKYHDFHDKLFFINNLDSTKECAFAETNRQIIKTDFGADKDVYFYDAKVSYLSQLKQRYDDGKATEIDYSHLMRATLKTPFGKPKKIKFQTFDEAWSFHIKTYQGIYDTNDTSSVNEYLEKAGFFAIVTALKAFVEKNDASAVIVSNGLIPMRKELVAIKRELRMRYVEPYTTSQEKLANLWNDRIAKVKEFQKFVGNAVKTELFHTNDGLTPCDRISNEEYEKIFTSAFYSEIAKEIAGVLYDNKYIFIASQAMRAIRDDVSIQVFPPKLKFKDNGRFQEVFGDLASPLIKKRLTDVITNKLKYALKMIESEQDKTIDNLFSPVAKNIELNIEQEWNRIFNDDRNFCMSDYLSIPRSLKGCVIEEKTETSSPDFVSDLGIGVTLVGGMVAQITTVVTGIAAMIAGYIGFILCDPTFTALIVCVLLGIGGTIVSTIAPDHVRDRFVDFLANKIGPMIKADASGSFRELINGQIKNILERYAKSLVVDLQKMKNQRDIALAPNPNQEERCFRAIEFIKKIKKQIVAYDTYLEKHTKK